MKCPVCDSENRSALCPRCGFDSSRDYEKYPTFGPVGKTASASALRKKWQQGEEPKKSVRRFPIWIVAAVCTVVVALGIWIGSGLGSGVSEPWRNNILRSADEVQDTNYNGYVDTDDAGQAFVFQSEYKRRHISSITVLDTLVGMPADAWDVSEAGDGSVMAWVKPNGYRYDLYIGAEGGVSAGKSCSGLFSGYENAIHITFGEAFHTENVQDMKGMFYGCESLSSLDLSSFDTSNVQDMKQMFYACSDMRSLDLSSFDTSKVQDMSQMFFYCWQMNSLNLTSFDTSNVQDMRDMFNDCYHMWGLRLSDRFVTTNADTAGMFQNCPGGDQWGHLLN